MVLNKHGVSRSTLPVAETEKANSGTECEKLNMS